MDILINGMDFSKVIDPYSVQVYHIKVQGRNAGTSMSGVDIFDTVRVKSCFSCKTGIVPAGDYQKMIAAAKQDFAMVTYQDPDTGKDVTRKMSLTAGRATRIPLLGGGYCYKNIALDFQEV